MGLSRKAFGIWHEDIVNITMHTECSFFDAKLTAAEGASSSVAMQ